MVKRVWRPERHEGVSSPQSTYGQMSLMARTTRGLDMVFLFSPPDFTCSGRLSASHLPSLHVATINVWQTGRRHNQRLHNRSIYTAGEGARVPNKAWADGSCDPNDTRACRLDNRSMVKQLTINIHGW